MALPPTVVVAFVLVALVQVGAAVVYAWWASDEPDEAADEPGVTPAHAPDGDVVCPHCTSKNEAGYRFCRACAGELHVGGAVAGRGESAARRA